MDKIVVLISGRGSNLKAICDSGLANQIACVISNNKNAAGLNIAQQYNIPSFIIQHQNYNSREEFEKSIAQVIDTYNPQFIVLAGFMRILSPWFVNKYHNQIINIHPSILPAFTGADATGDAIAYKVKLSGATVHIVTNQLDHGPILIQGIVPVLPDDTKSTLSDRILTIEHTIYPFTIRKLLMKQYTNINNIYCLTKLDTDNIYLKNLYNNIFY